MLVLLVDDDLDEYEIFREAVQRVNTNITCLHACNGSEALVTLQEMASLPNYVFLDSNMPVMDGRRCLRLIKCHERLKHIPVYIYSTSSNAAEMQHYKTLGALEFITKPGSFSALVDMLTLRLSGAAPLG